jgi:hypothetical protein
MTLGCHVIAARHAGIKVVPSIINAVVLTSAWSSGNSNILGSFIGRRNNQADHKDGDHVKEQNADEDTSSGHGDRVENLRQRALRLLWYRELYSRCG